MAFKILSQKELEYLNKQQREAYELAYEEYLERKSFVERLEKLEKVKIPTVSVKKKGIKKINAPSVTGVKHNNYKADTSASVRLLNVTKKVRNNLENSSGKLTFNNFKAELPLTRAVSAPKVDTVKEKSYLVKDIPSVPIAVPTAAQFVQKKFDVVIPEVQNIKKPELSEIKPDNYSVNGLPSIKTKAPFIPEAVSREKYNVALPSVNMAVPEIRNIEIAQTQPVSEYNVHIAKPDNISFEPTSYDVIQSSKFVASAPNVSYDEKKPEPVNLYSVAIPEKIDIPGMVETAEVDIPAITSVCTPVVDIEIASANISPLPAVHISEIKPQVSISAVNIEPAEAPVVSVPKEVCYVEPECSVAMVKTPSVTVPSIDTELELKNIMSKIG